MSVASRADPAIGANRDSAFPETGDTLPDEQDRQLGRLFLPLRWLRLRERNIEREIPPSGTRIQFWLPAR